MSRNSDHEWAAWLVPAGPDECCAALYEMDGGSISFPPTTIHHPECLAIYDEDWPIQPAEPALIHDWPEPT